MENRIQEFRISLGLSQCMLSEKVGVSRTSIHKIETGKSIPSLILACKIANALNMCVYNVFNLTETENYICKRCAKSN